ncbi:TIGR01841 family phasin [Phenylobacterium sp.]|jgi:phasin family protein|uniref:phasin family protein n=1 Tax=Phenylobacterium sp. TaxID=1871053 RepID=UPI002F418387
MSAAETVKTSFDQYTSAGASAFKDAVEKSLSALTEANGYSKKNLEAVVASVTAATKGAEVLGAQAMSYSKASLEGQVAAAKSLAGAKSLQEVVELQTAYAKSALETYMSQMGKMSETVAASMKDSLKPLNERVTAVVERLQAAR